jgi:hypothetical protein
MPGRGEHLPHCGQQFKSAGGRAPCSTSNESSAGAGAMSAYPAFLKRILAPLLRRPTMERAHRTEHAPRPAMRRGSRGGVPARRHVE